MLTNTVVLFLRDLLPMFIMFAYLSAILPSFTEHKWHLLTVTSVSLLLSALILLKYEAISDLFSGSGIEWLKISFVSLAYIAFMLVFLKPFEASKALLIALGCLLLLVVHISAFLLYFTVYFANTDLLYELLIGCIIGTGICVSFYFLFGFIMKELMLSRFSIVVGVLWSLFLANQFSLVANYLHQIDIVYFGTANIANMTGLINEDSEYGFIVKALTGFDARPSIFYAVLIVSGFMLMFGVTLFSHTFIRKKNSKQHTTQKNTQGALL